MTKLNAFYKELIVLLLLLGVQLFFSLFLHLSTGSFYDVEVSRSFITLEFQSTQSSFTYTPWLTGIYVIAIAGLLLMKEKPLATIYGLLLIMLVQFNYLRSIYALENQTISHLVLEGRLSQEIFIDQSRMAQDLSLYVLLVMIVIKIAIVVYEPLVKILSKKFSKTKKSTNKAIHM